VSRETGVVKDSHEAPVITCNEVVTAGRLVDDVDVGTVSAARVDTLHVPAELDSLGGPLSRLQKGDTRWLLAHLLDVPEEKFVATAVAAHVFALRAPVEGHDVGGVLVESSFEGPVTATVDVDVVVVRADCKHGAIWAESHALDPLS